MSKARKTILIVEDDAGLSKAIYESLSREGFAPVVANDPGQADKTMRLQRVDLVLIDCMLPHKSGVKLAGEFKRQSPDTPIILMSGVYKDRSFVKDALKKTQAVGFFQKPFNLDELVERVSIQFPQDEIEGVSPIYSLISSDSLSRQECLNLVSGIQSIHGFDLPLLYAALMLNEVTGHLNIVSSENEVSGVSFLKGEIVNVNVKDKNSYFGSILVKKGFISPDDLGSGLAMNGIKKIGEKLVDSNLLSPHAIRIALSEQMAMRLSQTVQEKSLTLSFIDSEVETNDAQINWTSLCVMLNEWAFSKFTPHWLKSFYLPLLDYVITFDNPREDFTHLKNLYHLRENVDVVEELTSGKSLQMIIDQQSHSETSLYRICHLLSLLGLIRFDWMTQTQDFSDHLMRLKRLKEEFESKNHFEVLGVSIDARVSEVKRAYLEFAKILHPDRLPPKADKETKKLTEEVFGRISEAYQTLSNFQSREEYRKQMEHGQAENRMEAEMNIEEGKHLLKTNQIKRAIVAFVKASELAPMTSEIKLHLLWCKLKDTSLKKDSQFYLEALKTLNSIPPEDRHTAIYYFVKGLLNRYQGDVQGARDNIQMAINLDKEFLDARREMNVLRIKQKSKKTTDVNDELKTVVGFFFNKKKKR